MSTDKLTDKLAAISDDGSYFSLEFFPPKTPMVSVSHMTSLSYRLTLHPGVFESSDPPGAYVPRVKTSFRDRDLGSRWLHLISLSGAC